MRHCTLTRRITRVNKRPRKVPTSKATWDAYDFMHGPLAISNFILLGAIILFAVIQPNLDDPSTYWALALGAILLVVAGGFKVQGAFRLRGIFRSAREDRRRIAEGLPLDPDEPERQPDSNR
jgi:hypothetical protein